MQALGISLGVAPTTNGGGGGSSGRGGPLTRAGASFVGWGGDADKTPTPTLFQGMYVRAAPGAALVLWAETDGKAVLEQVWGWG